MWVFPEQHISSTTYFNTITYTAFAFTMWLLLLITVSILQLGTENAFAFWDESLDCPKSCTCRLEHASEMTIYRFTQEGKQSTHKIGIMDDIITNEVYYEDTFDKEFFENKDIVKSVTCLLLTEMQPEELLASLPNNIESLILIQGSDSGNKTFKFSYLKKFQQLISLELMGSNLKSFENISRFSCEIDTSLLNIKYLNLERVYLKNSKQQVQKFVNEVGEDTITFEYVDKHDSNLHPLTLIRKDTKDILPYYKYLRQGKNEEAPLFIGFGNLNLLRISNCELNSVHWEMFDGLQNLKYLILEKNNLRFIPDFAFYGTPHLKTLSLAWNNLLNIQITDLAGLLELEYLDLSHNNFSQLSELSLPPFPNLKLANFGNNPITVIYPNTFEVMNTTESLIVGGDDTSLELLPNSFVGLKTLKSLTVHQLNIRTLQRDLFAGMSKLEKLILIGNIIELEFDAFLELPMLETLILTGCNIYNLSMDSFIGLKRLAYLDLSNNKLNTLPPGVFDHLTNLKELYLNGNNFTQLPRDIFGRIHLKLLRLNDNPWHCSCDMSDWKPLIVNKVKQKSIKTCAMSYDKTLCGDDKFTYKYIYDTKVAPKCATPDIYINWNIFHVMRRQFKCPDFKPKIRKIKKPYSTTVKPENTFNKIDLLNNNYTNSTAELPEQEDTFNELNVMANYNLQENTLDLQTNNALPNYKRYENIHKMRKFKGFK